jgi:hypothetical protein
MSVDFHIYRGEKLEDLVTLGRVDSFRDRFDPAVNELNLEWLPDIVGRAGLYIDRNNRDEVRREVEMLDNVLPGIRGKDQAFLAEVVRRMKAPMQQLLDDDELTGYVG